MKLNNRQQQTERYVLERSFQSNSSFYYTFLFLSHEKRLALSTFYLYCHEIDKVVDEVSDQSVMQQKLHWWRLETLKMFATDPIPTHPITIALTPYLEKFSIKSEYLLGIIDGMQMDLEQNRWLDFAQLQHYCFHVAGLVGVVSSHIMGFRDKRTLDFSAKLGEALQLTNIIRDIGEDAMRGRVYLPLDEMKQHGVSIESLFKREYSANFRALMQFQFNRAYRAYQLAIDALPVCDRKSQTSALMMAAIYQNLLVEIKASDFQVLHQRIALTPVIKLWLAWRTWMFGWRNTKIL